MLARYPRAFEGGRVVDALVDPSVGTMPTLLELCGLSVPQSVQGTSYLSLLGGGPSPTREAIYYEILMEREGPEKFPVPERGVRTQIDLEQGGDLLLTFNVNEGPRLGLVEIAFEGNEW